MIVAQQPIVSIGVSGLSIGAVFGLLALGLVLIYRTTGVLNFAHWAVGLLGVIAYWLAGAVGMPGPIAALLALVASAAMGVLAYRIVFRRVPRGNQIVVILIAIGVGQFYSSVAAMIVGFREFTKLEVWLPIFDIGILGTEVSSTEVITASSAIVISVGFLVWFRRSRTGRALRAIAQNREAAMLAGIDDIKYSSIAWGIGSALAALALILVLPHSAGDRGGLLSTFDLTPFGTLLIPAFGAALVGGLVHLPMALVGGAIFGVTRELLVLAPSPWNEMRGAVAALLIVFLLLLRTERFFTTRQELEALEA